jgi:hypothetical protein
MYIVVCCIKHKSALRFYVCRSYWHVDLMIEGTESWKLSTNWRLMKDICTYIFAVYICVNMVFSLSNAVD